MLFGGLQDFFRKCSCCCCCCCSIAKLKCFSHTHTHTRSLSRARVVGSTSSVLLLHSSRNSLRRRHSLPPIKPGHKLCTYHSCGDMYQKDSLSMARSTPLLPNEWRTFWMSLVRPPPPTRREDERAENPPDGPLRTLHTIQTHTSRNEFRKTAANATTTTTDDARTHFAGNFSGHSAWCGACTY